MPPVQDVKKLQHLIVSASYEGDRIVGQKVHDAVVDLFDRERVWPVHVVAYTTAICIPANRVSLTDAWQNLTDEQRLYVYDNMPQLFTAIFLAVKGINPPEKECDAVSKNGSYCVVPGIKHTVHVGPPGHDGRVSSEVWE